MAVVNQPVSQVGRAGCTVLPSPGCCASAAPSGRISAPNATVARRQKALARGMVVLLWLVVLAPRAGSGRSPAGATLAEAPGLRGLLGCGRRRRSGAPPPEPRAERA